MDLLLDTCTFLWLTAEPSKLSESSKEALDDEANRLSISAASIWEVCLKWKAGKLALPDPPRSWFAAQLRVWSMKSMPIDPGVLYRTTELPDHHRDPFDRLLVAQALETNMTIVTPGEHIRRYPVSVLW